VEREPPDLEGKTPLLRGKKGQVKEREKRLETESRTLGSGRFTKKAKEVRRGRSVLGKYGISSGKFRNREREEGSVYEQPRSQTISWI